MTIEIGEVKNLYKALDRRYNPVGHKFALIVLR